MVRQRAGHDRGRLRHAEEEVAATLRRRGLRPRRPITRRAGRSGSRVADDAGGGRLAHVVSPLGPGSRARTDTARKNRALMRALGRDTRGCRDGAARHALGRDRVRCRIIPIHNVKQRSLLRSRGALLRPGFVFPLFQPPHEGRAERRKAQYFCCRAFRRATVHAWRGAARVQRDALASRRSTVAILGRGPRFLLRHFLRFRAASSSQPGRHAWRAGSRTSRGRRLRAATAGRHSPLRLRLVSGDGPSDERGCVNTISDAHSSQCRTYQYHVFVM
jgi:hypothetical protein